MEKYSNSNMYSWFILGSLFLKPAIYIAIYRTGPDDRLSGALTEYLSRPHFGLSKQVYPYIPLDNKLEW